MTCKEAMDARDGKWLTAAGLVLVRPAIEDLKAAARARAENEPFSAMMGGKHVDNEGKTIVFTPDAGIGKPPEEWYHPIVGVSPFVSRLQAPLYALGFARVFPRRLRVGCLSADPAVGGQPTAYPKSPRSRSD
ncbi:hypothetical protein [Nitrobacter sp. JJSN]|uniref:hypothetical protein n=1 Tax=Nitrobacter sp. JJSN TaxID=3453033 RepID=UPI003F76AF4B